MEGIIILDYWNRDPISLVFILVNTHLYISYKYINIKKINVVKIYQNIYISFYPQAKPIPYLFSVWENNE